MRVAVVIPWFGRELRGGAEQHAWEAASRLSQRGHDVDVLTTCCRSHQEDWATNHLPAGVTVEPEGFRTHRFPVVERDVATFDRVCARLHQLRPEELLVGVSPIPEADAAVFTSELIKSPELLDYLRQNVANYDRFIVLPYLYGPVLDAIDIVREKAAFQPCLHDEAYAYLPQVAEAFYRAGSILFISEGEQQLALRLFGPGIARKSMLVGAGVEKPELEQIDDATRDTAPRIGGRFILYLGRKYAGKNVPLLLRAFSRFRSVRPNSDLQLVLAGPGSVDSGGGSTAVHDLGSVSETEKAYLLQNCVALVQPSENESFSRVMMEAWFYGRPVAAHQRCLATAVAVNAARGGWTAGDENDWARLFVELDRSSDSDLAAIGERGRRYADEMADWEQVIRRYEEALHPPRVQAPSSEARASTDGFAINQFLPNLAFGDAISNHALLIRKQLRSLGYRAEIFARFIDPRVADQCTLFSPDAVERSDALIYHHSIGSEITPHMVEFAGPKALVYHNITPAEYFEPYRPEFARILRQGRDDLEILAPSFPISVGDSAFNTAELAERGFRRPTVLPICIDPTHWAGLPDPELMRRLQDGRTNLLFVGRIAPNKKQDQLIRAFAHYRLLDPSARLSLVGPFDDGDPYTVALRALLRELRLEDAVELPGSISDAALQAYYRSAHLFWSMSEHEGFCVPLVEAMWFDLPVLAFKSSAVPETLGEAAFLLTVNNQPSEGAAAAYQLTHDQALRRAVVTAQRAARDRFLPEHGLVHVAELARRLSHAAERIAATSTPPSIEQSTLRNGSKPRVAFVVQRAGREVIGGAEALCLQIADRMAQHWETEVLTTCALDYSTWANYYPEGSEEVGGTTVRRFAVDNERDVSHFDELSAAIVGRGKAVTPAEQETWMREQGPISTGLFRHLSDNAEDYDAILFFGYLYATTYFGLPLVRERAVLVPLAHDEWTIHLPMWDGLFAQPAGVVFQTPEERDFLKVRFPHLQLHGRVAGIGIDAPREVDPAGFRERYGLDCPFLLYLGRVDASKGCGDLLAAFQHLKRSGGARRKLVLMGREVMPVPFDEDVVYLGSLSEQEKWNGLAACEWLVMPSPHESLSIALLEAWMVERPAIVNSRSAVLVGHCRRSSGGLWYETPEECAALINQVDAETRRILGLQGRAYVQRDYRWERIAASYQATLAQLLKPQRSRAVV